MNAACFANTAAVVVWIVGALSARCVAAQNASVVTLFEQTDKVPQITRERAITRAVNATGLKMTPKSVEYGLATDTSIPFFNVVKRPAWLVVSEGVEIFGRNEQGAQEKNINVGQISVLLDAETGALLKVASPKPPAGGLLEVPGLALESGLTGAGVVLRTTVRMPTVPFMDALGVAEREHPALALQAKEVVAYFGVMTDTLRTQNNIVQRPYWVIFAGGLNLAFPSGGPVGVDAPPVPGAREAIVIVDAESGKRYLTWLTSKGN